MHEPEVVFLISEIKNTKSSEKPKKKTGEEQAKEKGLTHFGMGRFGDGKNLTHIIHKGSLIPVVNPRKVTDTVDYQNKRRVTVEPQKEHPLEKLRSEKATKSLEKTLKDHNKELAKNLDKEEEDAVGSYISGKLDTALASVKRGHNPRDPETQKKIQKFDDLLKKNKTPESMSIYRPTNLDNLEKGKSYSFQSYLSGSLDPKEVEAHGKHLIHIEIPKGHPGLYNDRKKGKEYVLPRQSIIHVVSDPEAISVPDFDKKGGITKPQLLFKAIVKSH